MPDELNDLFGEPISIYTDAQAVEDGVLVPITGQGDVNRVTRAVFDHFVEPCRNPESDEMNVAPLLEAIRFMRPRNPNDGWRTGIYQDRELWLIPNEVGGLTLMFPEDY